MGLRKQYFDRKTPGSFGSLGDFLLEPALEGVPAERERDRWRLAVFDDVAGFRGTRTLGGQPLPAPLRDAMDAAAAARPHQGSKNSNACKLFERLRLLEPQHRLVLLKSAAEWIVARYLRGVENWARQRKEWENEKHAWEQEHKALTESIRERFTDVFKQLKDDERDDKPGLRKKNPRLCRYERLKQNINNCVYAGQKGHGPLCWKYAEFVKAQKAEDARFNDKAFWEAASILAELCQKYGIRKASNALQSQHIFDSLFAEFQRRRDEKRKNQKQDVAKAKADFFRIFKANWNAYLKAMGDDKAGTTLNDTTAIEKGRLPHCRTIGDKVFEKSECTWNPHTDYCAEYKRRLEAAIDPETLKLEGEYREWRKLFLAGPRKPSFKYPSSRELPMPKVFGEGFHEIDFDNSVLRLRLDDMRAGEWIELGFTPWPRGYKPSRKEIEHLVTSIHVNFVGTRARIGFRFDVVHRPSRFDCSQEEIDELRSGKYPRQAQDQEFLDAARKRLLETFSGDAKRELRMLAVDLGEKGAHAAFYEGKNHQKDVALKIIKINKAYGEAPQTLERNPLDKKMRGPLKVGKDDRRGLGKQHVGRHLEAIREGARQIAEKRRERESHVVTLEDHDFRGLKRHIAWMIRDWARHNARQIIAAAEEHHCDLIVFESLRGFRLPGYEQMDRDKKRRLAMFAFGRIRRKVMEKAVERGMRVVTAPYFKSSQVCSTCGRVQENTGLLRKNKKNRLFKCERKDCKAEFNSDANAARVLARVFWGEITLPSPIARNCRPAT